MKECKVVFNEDGSIKNCIEPFPVEGDNQSVKIIAEFPVIYADHTTYRRAEIRSTNGNSNVIDLTDDVLILDADYTAAGTTSITFELVKGSKYVRFEKVNISINPSVKLWPASQGKEYTVTVRVGETETVAPGQSAEVTNKGTVKDPVLNFKIPKGEKGDKGLKGDKGDTGDSGVYIGSSEPPPGKMVWLCPNGNPSNCEMWTFTLSDGSKVIRNVLVNLTDMPKESEEWEFQLEDGTKIIKKVVCI